MSYGFVFYGPIGEFFKMRRLIGDELKDSRLVFQTFSRNPQFLVPWNDLTKEKQEDLVRRKNKDAIKPQS